MTGSDPTTSVVRVVSVMRVVIAGVSGSGKSTIGWRVADALGAEFVDGDDLHPASNIAKMAAGTPLDDADREPWLKAIADALARSDRVVVACSALRRCYREALREAGSVEIIVLDVPMERADERVVDRDGHFMDATMVASQFATLERPDGSEPATHVIDATPAIDTVVGDVLDRLESRHRFAATDNRFAATDNGYASDMAHQTPSNANDELLDITDAQPRSDSEGPLAVDPNDGRAENGEKVPTDQDHVEDSSDTAERLQGHSSGPPSEDHQ